MLILAGVSINAIVGDNGILTRTQYASFLNEMAAVEEAVQLWQTGETIESKGKDTKAIPTKGMCKGNDLDSTERLKGEIGYYRNWSLEKSMPATNIMANDFNSKFLGEFIFYPAGVQDLYYLNNEACGIDSKKSYIIDAATGMVYSKLGISLKGVRCYSSNMAKAVMNGDNTAPIFAEAIVTGSGSGEALAGNPDAEYGFQIIADETNTNIYKLYNNGDLYGKGVKGNLLNTNVNQMEEINPYVWNEMTIPSNINNPIEVIPGTGTIFVIDSNKDLWAWGKNPSNYLGLSTEQQNEYTGREAVKLNINSKKVYKVIPNKNNIWVITEDDELYSCGYNVNGGLGIGEMGNQSDAFKKVDFLNPKNIKKIITGESTANYGTIILMNDGKIFFAGNSSNFMYNIFKNTELASTNITKFVEIFNGTYGTIFANKIIDISQYSTWGASRTVWLDSTGILYEMDGGGKYTQVETEISKISSNRDSALLIEKKTAGGEIKYKINTSGSGAWYNAIGITTRDNVYLDITEYLNGYFDVTNVKDFYAMREGVFFLLNNGQVYAAGYNSNLGINISSGLSNGVVSLKTEANIDSIDKLIYSKDVDAICTDCTFMLKSNDNRYYSTGNAELVFRNLILEESWTKINPEGVKVKKFKARIGANNSCAFIDENDDIWVSGKDVTILGINHNIDDLDLNNFVKLKDYLKDLEIYEHIDRKVEDYSFGSDCFYIKTNEKDNNTLYVVGTYKKTGWPYYTYSGLNEDTYIPSKLLENVEKFFVYSAMGRMALQTNGNLYIWGNNDGSLDGGISSLTPVLYQESSVKNAEMINDGFDKLYQSYYKGYIITKNKREVYAAGVLRIPNAAIGLPATANKYQIISKEEYFNNETVVDIGVYSSAATYFLTEQGNVYGCGNKKYIGKGSLIDQIITPEKIFGDDDVIQIAAGPGWAVAIKKDGSVWGTGTNSYGILGRWAGVGRGESNSRYKTAFNWVECPELEI